MKIVVKEAGKSPEIRDIKKSLTNMQKIVEGCIEVVYMDGYDNIAMICNEEGKFNSECMPNLDIEYDIVVGTVFFVGLGEEDFRSLKNHEVEDVLGYIKKHELEFVNDI